MNTLQVFAFFVALLLTCGLVAVSFSGIRTLWREWRRDRRIEKSSKEYSRRFVNEFDLLSKYGEGQAKAAIDAVLKVMNNYNPCVLDDFARMTIQRNSDLRLVMEHLGLQIIDTPAERKVEKIKKEGPAND